MKPFDLKAKKPALLLLDAEGGILHKQQLCVDPKKYLKIMKSAAFLKAKRIKLRDRYLKLRRDARTEMTNGEYAKALRTLERMLKRRDMLTGHVLALVESDREELEAIGEDLLDRANQLRDDRQLLDSYELYKQIDKEFARLRSLSRKADRCAKEVASDLKRMGVKIR